MDGGDEQFQPVRLNEIFSMFRRNKYVWLYAIIMLCYNISTSLAVTTYYFKYIIGNTAMMSVTSIFSIVLLPLMLVFMITSLETIGDITATSDVSEQPVSGPLYMKRLKGGVLANGLNSFVSAVFNTFRTPASGRTTG